MAVDILMAIGSRLGFFGQILHSHGRNRHFFLYITITLTTRASVNFLNMTSKTDKLGWSQCNTRKGLTMSTKPTVWRIFDGLE